MLAGIQRAKKVEDATSSKDENTPVYLLEELSKLALRTPEDALHLTDHFVKRLDSRSPITKAKALKGIKYLCSRGCIDFQKGMQSRTTAIRPLQNFQGPVDQLKGDALNARVREAANEAIVAIFETNASQSLKNAASSSQGRMQAFGSNIQNGYQPAKQAGSQKMVGFGSEQYRSGLMANKPTLSSGSAQRYPMTPASQTFKATLLTPTLSKQSAQDAQSDNHTFSGAPKHSVMGNEAELVNDICEPGGMRLQPALENLERFLFMASSLSGPKIAQELRAKIEGPSWQEIYRALCALQHLLQNGSSVSCGEVAVNFQVDSSAILKLTKSPQASLRERGAAVMKLLVGEDEANPPESSSTPTAQNPSNPPPDLLGDLLGYPDDGFSTLQDPSIPSDPGLKPAVDEKLSTLQGSNDVRQLGVGDMFSGLSLSSASPNPPEQATGVDANLATLSASIDPFFGTTTSPISSSTNPMGNAGMVTSVITSSQNGMHNLPNPQHSVHHAPQMQNFPELMGGVAHPSTMNYPGATGAAHLPMYSQVGLPSQGLSGVASGYRPMGGERSNSTQLQAAQVYECLMYQGVHGMSLGGFMAGMIPQGMAAGPHMMGPMYPQNVMSHAIPQGGSMMGTSPWVQQPSIPMGAVNEPTDAGSSGPVPLMAFVGPANTKRQNSSGRNQPAFNFIGDELKAETLRQRK